MARTTTTSKRSTMHLGDVSEFQEELDAAVYIAGGHSA